MRVPVRLSQKVRLVVAGFLLLLPAMTLSACSEVETKSAAHYEPSKLEPIEGSEFQRVIFTAEGARRVGLKTEEVRAGASKSEKRLPVAALLYDGSGAEFVYTSPKPLEFLRVAVTVKRVNGNSVFISKGPPIGTKIVTVGAAEVYGAEYGVSQ